MYMRRKCVVFINSICVISAAVNFHLLQCDDCCREIRWTRLCNGINGRITKSKQRRFYYVLHGVCGKDIANPFIGPTQQARSIGTGSRVDDLGLVTGQHFWPDCNCTLR